MADRARLKRGRASLIGGCAVGLCILALWIGGMHELHETGLVAGLLGVLLAAAVAAWVRLADL
jgi:hypothetical protein